MTLLLEEIAVWTAMLAATAAAAGCLVYLVTLCVLERRAKRRPARARGPEPSDASPQPRLRTRHTPSLRGA